MTKERLDTRIHLVAELEKLPKSDAIDEMIAEAKAGEYHDYKNQKYACGKTESYNRLKELGYDELANRISNGDFDEVADEEDKEMMRKTVPEKMWSILEL